jgi:hypothetical protein
MSLSYNHWTIGWKSNPWGGIISIADILNNQRGYGVRFHRLWCLWLNDWDGYSKKQHTGSCDNTEQSFPDTFRLPARQGREERATNLMSEIIIPVVDLQPF